MFKKFFYSNFEFFFFKNEFGDKKNIYVEQAKEQIEVVQRILERNLDNLLQHWKLSEKYNLLRRKEDKGPKPVVLRHRQQRIKSDKNWKLFYYEFGREHYRSNLIWNHKVILFFLKIFLFWIFALESNFRISSRDS